MSDFSMVIYVSEYAAKRLDVGLNAIHTMIVEEQ